jgi:diacylglycerol kinase family enzyme
MIRLFLQLKDGRHWSEKFLETRKVKHIDLELKEKGIINIDGEPYTYSKRASIVCEQQNIPVFSPKV